MKTPTANYWLDVLIGIAFLLSGVSGLVFLAPATDSGSVLGLGYALWGDVHTWSSLALIAGVGAHLALHWKWIVAMTRRRLGLAPTGRSPGARVPGAIAPRPVLSPVPVTSATPSPRQALLSRRGFLVLGGGVTVWAGLMAASLGVIARSLGAAGSTAGAASGTAGTGLTDSGSAGASNAATGAGTTAGPARTAVPTAAPVAQATATAAPEIRLVEPLTGVACRKGYVNDPYPGRCHDYTDRDGDGICDYSVLGSGSRPVRRNG